MAMADVDRAFRAALGDRATLLGGGVLKLERYDPNDRRLKRQRLSFCVAPPNGPNTIVHDVVPWGTDPAVIAASIAARYVESLAKEAA